MVGFNGFIDARTDSSPRSSVSDAIRNGWALREVMRAWRVTTPEELSGWLRSQGFPATRPGQHLSARAQEFIFHEGGVLDARVALLETAFVLITLEQGRGGIPPVGGVREAKGQTSQQHCWRGEGLEVVRVDPLDVVASTPRIWIIGAR